MGTTLMCVKAAGSCYQAMWLLFCLRSLLHRVIQTPTVIGSPLCIRDLHELLRSEADTTSQGLTCKHCKLPRHIYAPHGIF